MKHIRTPLYKRRIVILVLTVLLLLCELSITAHATYPLSKFMPMTTPPSPEQLEETNSGVYNEDVHNILLIVTDSSDNSADIIILCTTNKYTGKLILTSFMPNLYANISGYGAHRLDYAYSVSGAKKLVETIEKDYQIDIDNYAMVDFNGLVELFNLVGGVDIEIAKDEVSPLNRCLLDKTQSLASAGNQHLTGTQAVAYMRSLVGNYNKADRQVLVLRRVLHSVKTLGVTDLVKLAWRGLALTESDVTASDVLDMAKILPDVKGFTFVNNKIPYSGTYTTRDNMLVPNFNKNIEKFHKTLYE